MSVRDDLAAAVTVTITVDGVDIDITGHPVQPDTIGPWDAWPVWQSTVWVNQCAREHTYGVIVALPSADAATFVPAADDVVEELGTALYAKGFWPGTSTPVQVLVAAEGPMPAVQIQVTV